MDTGEIIASVIIGAIGLIIPIALVFFIIKRIKDKRKETFEKRDN